MKKTAFGAILLSLTALTIFIFLSHSIEPAVTQTGFEPREYIPNEILVKFRDYPAGDILQSSWLIRNIIGTVQGRIRTYLEQELSPVAWDPSIFAHRSFIGDPYLFLIKVPRIIDVDYAISLLRLNEFVEYVEKNGIVHIDETPNDERFDEQWALFEIDAPEAWDLATGSAEIVVAVLDTGVDLGHPDLAANIWNNSHDPDVGEGYEGVDNDLNGFTDDING